MRTSCTLVWLLCCLSVQASGAAPAGDERAAPAPNRTQNRAQNSDDNRNEDRLAWWREARLGMFIHWGLYAVPGGKWGGKDTYGEWIRHEAKIPLAEYDRLRDQFNPVGFDAERIVLAAKRAGMRYIVITTKHHDGFCLFDSKQTDFTVMATPFKRDIMREMADACRKHDMRLGWYYSIMDWHHPDYLPRRDWETDRPVEGADFERYIAYMKAQLKELLTNYGEIGVLWFDGQWEGSWNDARGKALEAYVRSLAPRIIINSRVGRGGGSYGLERDREMLGDYATPEQFIPEQAPGFDWETCMTMNDHWGYNAADHRFKTTQDLIRKLADIASKGGNFLLNIGPTAQGEIPPESVDRLAGLGAWMDGPGGAGEAIRSTSGGPFKRPFTWGRCTMSPRPASAAGPATRLYLHVFEWPADGRLIVPGLLNRPLAAFPIARPGERLPTAREGENVVLSLTARAHNPDNSVIVLDIEGAPDIASPPVISAPAEIFVDDLEVTVASDQPQVEFRYTTDGREPDVASTLTSAGGAIRLTHSAQLAVRAFRAGQAVSPVARRAFSKVAPLGAVKVLAQNPGLEYEYFERPAGEYQSVGEFDSAQPLRTGVAQGFDLSSRAREKYWGFRFRGFLAVPEGGVYHLYTRSDDGSRLWIGDRLVVDNDKPHSFLEAGGAIALSPGLHPITVSYFENWGGFDLKVLWSGPQLAKQEIPLAALRRR